MRNKQIIDAWNKIKPSEDEEGRMLTNILRQSETEGILKNIYGKKVLISLAGCLILITAFYINFANRVENVKVGKSVPQEIANTVPATKEPTLTVAVTKEVTFDGFVLTAYSSKAEGAYLSMNYQEDTMATELKPDVKVLLAKYSPLMSSVPGLPFTFGINESDSNSLQADSMNITVDNGELLSWDKETGIVTSRGTSVLCQSGETLYWSPLLTSDDSKSIQGAIAANAQITVTAIKDGKEIGKQIIFVTEADDGYYATVGKLILS